MQYLVLSSDVTLLDVKGYKRLQIQYVVVEPGQITAVNILAEDDGSHKEISIPENKDLSVSTLENFPKNILIISTPLQSW